MGQNFVQPIEYYVDNQGVPYQFTNPQYLPQGIHGAYGNSGEFMMIPPQFS